MAAQDAPVRSRLQAHDDGSAPCLDKPDADRSGQRYGHGDRVVAGWQRTQDPPHDAHRLAQLVETQGDSREHVTVLPRAPAQVELSVRRARRIHAQVEQLSAGSPGEADQPDPGCKFGQHGAGTRESIPQARVLFVDAAQCGHFIGELHQVLVEHRDSHEAYASSGAVEHTEWEQPRIGFQPYAYPSYTERLVKELRLTTVDANTEWLAKLDPAKVHEDLVSTAINSRAIEAAGGLSVFGASPTRKELVQP